MNVEGDFRFVDSGGFDECTDFLEYLNERNHNWEEAFVDWIAVSERRKADLGKSQNYWGPLNLVKVLEAWDYLLCLISTYMKLEECLMPSQFG